MTESVQLATLTPDLLKQARAIAAQELAAAQAPIDARAAEAARTSASHGDLIKGLAEGLAGVLGDIAPRVSGAYDTAATRQATFAKGLSDGLRMKSEGAAGETNAFLDTIGAPAGQHVSPDSAVAAGDTLYGLGGYIPASDLNREGAAFGAAAEALPGYARLRGQEDFTSNLFAGDQQQRTFDDQIATLAAGKPKLVNDLYSQLEGMRVQKRAADVNQAIAIAQLTGEVTPQAAALLGIPKGTKTAAAKAAAASSTKPDASLSRLFGYVVNSDGQPLLSDGKLVSVGDQAASEPKVSSSLSKAFGFLVDTAGNPIVRNGKLVQLPSAAKKSKFTPLQVQSFSGKAYTIADDSHNGYDVDDKTVPGGLRHVDPVTYQEALNRMRRAGIPESIAKKTLNALYKPGELGRPGKPLTAAQQAAFDIALNPVAALTSGAP